MIVNYYIISLNRRLSEREVFSAGNVGGLANVTAQHYFISSYMLFGNRNPVNFLEDRINIQMRPETLS